MASSSLSGCPIIDISVVIGVEELIPAIGYLRITRYTVLETRIYLDNPALLNTWLLHPRDPALPKIIESVRGLVLPKLREEIDKGAAPGGGAKKKKGGVKDIVVGDGFEVSIFLTVGGTRHAVMTKTRTFFGSKKKLKSTSSKMLGNQATEEGEQDDEDDGVVIRQESPEDNHGVGGDVGGLGDIPMAEIDMGENTIAEIGSHLGGETIVASNTDTENSTTHIRSVDRRGTRTRTRPERASARSATSQVHVIDDSDDDENHDNNDEDEYQDQSDSPPSHQGQRQRQRRTRKTPQQEQNKKKNSAPIIIPSSPATAEEPGSGSESDQDPDKKSQKKANTITTYEGFSLYGRVLCLVVKRTAPGTTSTGGVGASAPAGGRSKRGASLVVAQGRKGNDGTEGESAGGQTAVGASSATAGSGMLEEWITMTQIAAEEGGGAGDEE